MCVLKSIQVKKKTKRLGVESLISIPMASLLQTQKKLVTLAVLRCESWPTPL